MRLTFGPVPVQLKRLTNSTCSNNAVGTILRFLLIVLPCVAGPSPLSTVARVENRGSRRVPQCTPTQIALAVQPIERTGLCGRSRAAASSDSTGGDTLDRANLSFMATERTAIRIVRFETFEADLATRKNPPEWGANQAPGPAIRNSGDAAGTARRACNTRGTPTTALADGHIRRFLDHGVNAAINRLREALGDSAENPRFVETIPRRGYRFVAPVESPTAVPGPRVIPTPGPNPESLLARRRHRHVPTDGEDWPGSPLLSCWPCCWQHGASAGCADFCSRREAPCRFSPLRFCRW